MPRLISLDDAHPHRATRGSVVIIAGPQHDCDRGQGNWKAKFMAVFTLKPSASCLKKAALASGLFLISAKGHAVPGSDGPFLGLSGHWSGAGTVTLTNGATERIRCKAAYAVNSTGKAVQQTLRCASDSYRVEISSNVISEGGSLSGSWPRRLTVCREIFPAAPAVRRSSRMWLGPASRPVSTCGPKVKSSRSR